MGDMRLGYPGRTLIALAALLMIIIVIRILPLRGSVTVALALTVFVSAVILIIWRTQHLRQVRIQSSSILTALDAATASIPADLRTRMPLLMVTGDGLESIFTDDANSLTKLYAGAIWVRVNRSVDLPKLCTAVYAWRDSRPPDGVVLSIAPDAHGEETLATMLRLSRQALSDSSRLLSKHLPGYIAVYQRLTRESDARPQWLGFSSTHPLQRVETLTAKAYAADILCPNASNNEDNRHFAWRSAGMSSLIHWSQSQIAARLFDRRQSAAPWPLYGLAWIDCGPVTNTSSPWNLHLQSQTCLTPPTFVACSKPWPLPEPFLESLPRQAWVSPRIRTLTHAIAISAFLAALAIWGSAQNNQKLINSTEENIKRFNATPVDHDDARRSALSVLTDDRDRLDRHQRIGVPLRLDFGLYRGAELLPVLNRAIASYQPPIPPPAVITLDGLSLFESSTATLKTGSTRAMISVLDAIKSHPNKRILIAGHTDSSGDATKNQHLSEQRATAVRDWLMETSGLPVSAFAIQGYGGSRPIADNATPEGRARNRRVEITLIPETAGT